jgi:hypothetical protein
MRRIRGVSAAGDERIHAWPLGGVALDPYAGDEALFMAGDYGDYLTHGTRIGAAKLLDESRYLNLDARFEALYRALLDGEHVYGELSKVARALLVWGAPTHDRRPAPIVPHVLDDRDLALMAEDQLSQLGIIAPDRILGPFADAVLPRSLRVVAGAAMCFAPEVPPGVPAWSRVIKRPPRPPRDVRMALRAMARVPPMVWRIGSDDMVDPYLPVAPSVVPTGPVTGLPPTPGVVGRMVPGPDGWVLVAGLPLPALPPAESLSARLHLELLRLRRRERRLSFEDLLRDRGEVLYRSCAEWLYCAGYACGLV